MSQMETEPIPIGSESGGGVHAPPEIVADLSSSNGQAPEAWAREAQERHFRLIIRGHTGFMVICRKGPNVGPGGKQEWTERGFSYPDELPNALDYIGSWAGLADVYYRTALYDHRDKHTQEHIAVAPIAYGDLDACSPDKLKVPASIELETSPDRWQAAWLLNDVDVLDAEDISRRIAYEHRADGADVSGWDRGQVLRVPATPNLKYPDAVVRVAVERPAIAGMTSRSTSPSHLWLGARAATHSPSHSL
jgi:hypothetical protein